MKAMPKKLLTLLACAGLLGCQQPDAPFVPFGAEVTGNAAHDSALPAALTEGRHLPAGSYVPDQLIVTLSADADLRTALAGFEALGTLSLSKRFAAVSLPTGMSLSDAHRTLRARPGVEGLSLNFVHRAASVPAPTPSRFDEQWAHHMTGTRQLWRDHGMATASHLIVAVLDSGLDTTHPEFAGRVVAPQNFTPDNGGALTDVKDGHKHGTHVAGIIGAQGLEVAGVAPDVALMPIKVLDNANSGTTWGIVQGMTYAMGERITEEIRDGEGQPQTRVREPYMTGWEPQDQRRVRVMNMSLGSAYHGKTALYESALAAAKELGILVVVSAGNDGIEVGNPANSPNALAVSSTSVYRLGDRYWEWLSGFSNRGDAIGLAGPGGQILSTMPWDDYQDPSGAPQPTRYGLLSGTSMAAPYVAGAAALVIAKYPPTDGVYDAAYVERIKAHLFATADDLGAPGKDPKYGYGRINVLRALQQAPK